MSISLRKQQHSCLLSNINSGWYFAWLLLFLLPLVRMLVSPMQNKTDNILNSMCPHWRGKALQRSSLNRSKKYLYYLRIWESPMILCIPLRICFTFFKSADFKKCFSMRKYSLIHIYILCVSVCVCVSVFTTSGQANWIGPRSFFSSVKLSRVNNFNYIVK